MRAGFSMYFQGRRVVITSKKPAATLTKRATLVRVSTVTGNGQICLHTLLLNTLYVHIISIHIFYEALQGPVIKGPCKAP